MLGPKIIQLLKAIPLLLWGALVWAFNAGPAEVTSKTAAWAKFFGYPDLPAYIATKSTDRYVLIAAGIIAALYILVVWVWPWLHSRYPRLIPLQEAALRGFEEAERLGLEDTISSIDQWGDDKLEWYRNAFLLDENLKVYGRKLPSRQLRPIPSSILRHLITDKTKNELTTIAPYAPAEYGDVVVTRGSFRRYLRRLHRLARAKL